MKDFYNRLKYILSLAVILWMGIGCKKKETTPVPTYVHVDSFIFTASSATPVNTSQITAVWAYYNGNPIGVFDLPANIPIIANGTGKLTLRPGIAVDGFNNFMAAYPFYRSDTSTLVAAPGQTVNYMPHTGYYSACKFKTISTFDVTTQSQFGLASGSVRILTNLTTQVGEISLTLPADTLSEDSSYVNFPIPVNQDAYLELDYKSEVPLFIGLRADLAGLIFTKYYLGGINPSDHWQKFYLAVKDFAAQYKATSYNVFIKAVLPAGQSTGKVYLDNIQLVYFE